MTDETPIERAKREGREAFARGESLPGIGGGPYQTGSVADEHFRRAFIEARDARDRRLNEAARRLVGQEIHACASSLIYGFQQVCGDLSRDQLETLGVDDEDLMALAYRDADADDYRDQLDSDDEKRLKVERVENEPEGESWRWQVVDPDDGEVLDEGSEEEELDAWRALFDADSKDQPDGSEIFEHWIVSNWFADKLEAAGERVRRDVAGFTIWGRATTGQAIAMDSVIQSIAARYFMPSPEPEPGPPRYTADGSVVGGFYRDGVLMGTVRGDDLEAPGIARRVADALNKAEG